MSSDATSDGSDATSDGSEAARSGGLSGKAPRRLSARFHLAITYLIIIWVTLALLMAFLSQYLSSSNVASRLSYLYAQAHLLASAVEASGGPAWGVMRGIGGIPASGRVLLIDSAGRVLDDSASDHQFQGKDLRGVAEASAAISGQQMANTYYLEDRMFTAYVAVPAEWSTAGAARGGAVFISQDLSDIVASQRSIMRAVLLGGAGASVLALVVAWGLSSVVLGPMLELSGIARRMALGRLDLRATPRGPKETRDLAESFNYMASGIEKTMSAHEEFLLAAAHELRSPLAAMSATVESMEIRDPAPDELPGFFQDMRGELTRIIHTTEEILELLRTSHESQVQVEKVVLDGVGYIRELVESQRKAAEDKSVTLEFRTMCGPKCATTRWQPDAPCVDAAAADPLPGSTGGFDVDPSAGTIVASPTILRLVVGNLLDNALKYTSAGGSVTVEARLEGRDFVLKVADTGKGIPPSELPRVFDRFYRVDRARQKSTGGAGLGLAIVKEACERSGGAVSVESEEGKGSTFAVVWRDAAGDALERHRGTRE